MNDDDASEYNRDDDIDELNEALRVLERAYEEREFDDNDGDGDDEPRVVTRALAEPDRLRLEQVADHYAEYVVMGWRGLEPQDIGKVVFNR